MLFYSDAKLGLILSYQDAEEIIFPEGEDAAGIKKPFCGCGLLRHFVLYILVYIDGNYIK